MGMQVVAFEAKAERHHQDRYGDEPGFREAMRQQAAHAMAETMLRDASLYERIDPTEDELKKDPFAPTRHRWRLGVERNLSEVEARERQMAEARREGLMAAAEVLRDRANKFERVEGNCKWVLMSELRESARALESIANEQSITSREE